MSTLFRRLIATGCGWHATRAAAVLVFVVASCGMAAAQDPPPQDPLAPAANRPPVAPKIPPSHLDLGLSVFEGYDSATITLGVPGLAVDPRLRQDVSFSSASASLAYTRPGSEKTFSTLLGTDLRYYSVSPEVLPVNFYGGLNYAGAMGRRWHVRASGSAGYSPFYSFGDFLSVSDPTKIAASQIDLNATRIAAPQTDQGVARLDTYSTSGSTGLTYTLTQRSSLDFNYNIDYVDTSNTLFRVMTQGGGIGYSYRKTKYLNLRLGYGYHRSKLEATTAPYFQMHNIDAGVGYRRPLSFSRRSVVGFNVGSTLLTQGGVSSYYVTGDASLTHQLSQTWATNVAYNRSVSKFAGLTPPFVSDVVTAGLGGLYNTKTVFNFYGGYSHGSSAGVGSQNTFDAIFAGSRVNYKLTRYIPIYAEYIYYFYQFDQTIGLATGIPLYMRRQGLRTGLSYSLPLIGQRAGQR